MGGTKITAALICNGEVLKTYTTATDSDKAKEIIAFNLEKAINKVITNDTHAIGIGVPGIIDCENGIIREVANIPSWKNIQLKMLLEDKFNKQVFVNNDANCFVLGNKLFGAGLNFDTIIGVTLGTGLGAGIIINNKLFTGTENGAGEFGQLPYKEFKYETYCSAQFFNTIKKREGDTIYQLAEEGDFDALLMWQEFGNHLGELIKVILYSLAPGMIVLGGSVSRGFNFFQPALRKKMAEFELRKVTESVKIVCDNNPNSSVLGAAALCF